MHKIDDLKGKTLSRAYTVGDSELYLITDDGWQCVFSHSQQCCESVWIESVSGDLEDLIGTPILLAGVNSSYEDPSEENDGNDTLWTFYRFATVKGFVTVRWCGTSNGYYSTEVDFGSQKLNDSEQATE